MGSSRARVKSRLRYGMYSRIAGTGLVAASAGSQMRAARRQPSDSGSQQFSITRTARGNRSTIFIDALIILDFLTGLWIYAAALAGGGIDRNIRASCSRTSSPAS